MPILLAFAVLPAVLAFGLKNYADPVSVLEMYLIESLILAAAMLFAGRFIFKKSPDLKDIALAAIAAEAPALVFVALSIFGAPAYVVSETGALTMIAGAVLLFFHCRKFQGGRLFAVLVSFIWILSSWILSVYVVRPPFDIALPASDKLIQMGVGIKFSEEARKIAESGGEYPALKLLLADLLDGCANNRPLKYAYYEVPQLASASRANPERVRHYLKSISAAEIPGAAKFRICGRMRKLRGASPEEGYEEVPFEAEIVIVRILSREGKKRWQVRSVFFK